MTYHIIGRIIDTPLKANESGEVTQEAVYHTGYYISSPYNIPELQTYRVNSLGFAAPHSYAGVRTHYYKFADEKEWQSVLSDNSITTTSAGDGETTQVNFTYPRRNTQPLPPDVPPEVTMRQARTALASWGLLEQINSVIASMEEPTKTVAKIEWEYSQVIQRNRDLVNLIGPALELSEEDLDNLFIEASNL